MIGSATAKLLDRSRPACGQRAGQCNRVQHQSEQSHIATWIKNEQKGIQRAEDAESVPPEQQFREREWEKQGPTSDT